MHVFTLVIHFTHNLIINKFKQQKIWGTTWESALFSEPSEKNQLSRKSWNSHQYDVGNAGRVTYVWVRFSHALTGTCMRALWLAYQIDKQKKRKEKNINGSCITMVLWNFFKITWQNRYLNLVGAFSINTCCVSSNYHKSTYKLEHHVCMPPH